ncbi:MAG: NAD-dependent malic enzyme [Verrucomicrobiota bacterium]
MTTTTAISNGATNGSHFRGERILRDPMQNKDAAFTLEERRRLGIDGLLPGAVQTIEQQVALSLENIFAKSEPLEQYIGLIALMDRNETLFYRVLLENLERLTPIVYTPTVGLACQRYSHIYRRPRGLFITPDDRGHIVDRLRNFSERDIRLIVVTDNERILGLGDQGAGGMGISIGKLILYTVGAGIHPSHCLPISLDVGTDNAGLLEDPFYLGYRARRLRGAEYDSLVEEFVEAVRTVFPHALLQWEDFKKGNAIRLLERYVGRLACFNDDIQGTAAVTLAGVFAGLNTIKQRIRDQRFLLVGTGAAGVGIGQLLMTAMTADGLPPAEGKTRLLFLDSGGLVASTRTDLEKHKRAVAWTPENFTTAGFASPLPTRLEDIISIYKPTVLIGTTGRAGEFIPAALRALAKHCERPLIFPLSNPTANTECTPSEAIQASEGRALVATGSPFEPVLFGGKKHIIGQCNNAFIFPGVGLGALIARVGRVTDSMFLAAAKTLAEFTCSHDCHGALYPSLNHLRAISRTIGFKVAQTARDEGIGRSYTDDQLNAELDKFIWHPDYANMR